MLTRHPLETYSAYLDGHCLSDGEVTALRSWIGADEKNAIQFVEFAVLHAAVTERLRLDRLLDDLASHRTAGGISPSLLANAIREIELSSPRVLEATPVATPIEPTPAFPWATAATIAAVAASLLVAGWGLWNNSAEIPLPQVADVKPAVAPAEIAPPPKPQPIARLATSFDAKWSGDPLSRREKIFAGRSLTLLSGVAEFQMVGGAVVVVEGPSELELNGPDALSLSQGKAAVRVAPGGNSFIIDTPTMQVIDLGTEFGVETSDSGASQVMVFDGVVALTEEGVKPSSAPISPASINGPRLEAGFQVSIDENESPLEGAAQPEILSNPRHFLRPDEIEARHRALDGSQYDQRLAEHYERQRISGLLAYQPFDPASSGHEFAIGMGSQGVVSTTAVKFAGEPGRGGIDVQDGEAFIWLDTLPSSPLARAGYLKTNGLVGESGREIWLTWTAKRLQSKPDQQGSAGVSLMFGDRSDFDEPIFMGRGFGLTEEFCMQSAWGGGPPPEGERVDVNLDVDAGLPGVQTDEVDDEAHQWLARIEFRDGMDRVSIWVDQDVASVDLGAPQATIDVVDVEFDRLRLAVNREDESWRFSDFAAVTELSALTKLEEVGDFHIDK